LLHSGALSGAGTVVLGPDLAGQPRRPLDGTPLYPTLVSQGLTPMTNHLAIQLKNVRKSYGDHEVIKGISLDIHHGQVVSIIGGSGSGKSTLLRCMNFLETYNEGEIL